MKSQEIKKTNGISLSENILKGGAIVHNRYVNCYNESHPKLDLSSDEVISELLDSDLLSLIKEKTAIDPQY